MKKTLLFYIAGVMGITAFAQTGSDNMADNTTVIIIIKDGDGTTVITEKDKKEKKEKEKREKEEKEKKEKKEKKDKKAKNNNGNGSGGNGTVGNGTGGNGSGGSGTVGNETGGNGTGGSGTGGNGIGGNGTGGNGTVGSGTGNENGGNGTTPDGNGPGGNGPLALEDNNSVAALVAYPNPANDQLYLSNIPSNAGTYVLVNMEGVEAARGSVQGSELNLNVRNYTRGVYTIQLLDNNQTVLYKNRLVITN